MPVDLAFELSYLLSDETGREVEVVSLETGPGGRLCIRARIDGEEREACTTVAACKNLEGPRLIRCLARSLAQGGKPLQSLARALLGEGNRG